MLLICVQSARAGWFTDGDYEYIYEGNSDKLTVKNHFDDQATSIDIPHTVVYRGKTYTVNKIGECAFFDHVNLTSVTIPDWIEAIGAEAFDGCTGLTSITIPATVKRLGDYAFKNCSALAEINLPSTLEMIGCGVFNNTAWLNAQTDTEVYLGDYLIKYSKGGVLKPKAGCLGIAGTTNEGGFGHSASGLDFSDCEATLRFIGTQAFFRNSSLTSFTLPANLERIGPSAFNRCTNLEEVNAGNKLVEVGNKAFTDTKLSGTVRDVVYVGNAVATYTGANNADVTVRSGITLIADAAFDYVTLNSLTLPQSVTSLGRMAFNGSTIGRLTLPASITDYYLGYDYIWWANISDWDYGLVEDCECRYYPEDYDPDSGLTIDGAAYFNSSAPFADATIGAFQLTGSGTLQVENGVLYDKGKTIVLKASQAMPSTNTLNANVKYTAFSAFSGLTISNRYLLPDGVEVVGARAWMEGTLDKMDIPANVKYVGHEAFYSDSHFYLYYANRWPNYYSSWASYYHKVVNDVYFHAQYPPIVGLRMAVVDEDDPTYLHVHYYCPELHILPEAVEEMNLLKEWSWHPDNFDVKSWDEPDMKDLYNVFANYQMMNDGFYNDYRFYANYGVINDLPDRYFVPVTVSRVGYATAYIPFVSDVPEGVNAYVEGAITDEDVNGQTYKVMTLPEVEDRVLAPFEGCVIKGSQGRYSFDECIDEDATATVTGAHQYMHGQECHDIARPNDQVYSLTNQYSTPISPVCYARYVGDTMGAYKVWLEMEPDFDPTAKAVYFRLGFDDEVTVIPGLTTGADGTAADIYDLQGRHVNGKPGKGIYITNGKKHIIK